MSSRAAFLPTPGDPFLLTMWLDLYNRYWRDEISQLYIYLNGPTSREIETYNKTIAQKHGAMILHSPTQKEHGEALRIMLMLAEEENIMLVEDDGFIFKSGKVDECFRKLESGQFDIVGSPRGSCSQEILDKAKEKWNLDYSGEGDVGCNFWPNFFFTRRELLLKTDKNFASVHYDPGQMIRGLNIEAENEIVGDTFVSASLQLRALTNKIYYEPQYHGNTNDEPDYEARRGIWSSEAAWLHVGSLSSGYNNLLSLDKPLPTLGLTTDQEKLELERRIAFWWLAWEIATAPGRELYKQAIDRLIVQYELPTSRVGKRVNMYREVLYGI